MSRSFISVKLERPEDEETIYIQNLKGRLDKYMKGTTKGFDRPLIPEQQEVLKDYYKHLLTERPKVRSLLSYIDIMRILSLYGKWLKKPYNEVNKEELKDFFFEMHNQGRQQSTIDEYKIKIKRFYQFLYGTKDYPEVVEWIKVAPKKLKVRTEEELLSRADIKKMLSVCDNSRDRALIKVLFESAARRAEILSCDVRHALPDKYGFKLKLPKSKTKERAVRLIDSVPELQQWLNDHAYKDEPFKPLFYTFKKGYGRRLTASGIQNLVIKIGKRARLNKKISCHLFRHSRLDELGKLGFNERDLQIIAGWTENTKMPKYYLHYGEKEVDRKLLEREGKLTDEDKQEEIKDREALSPKPCPRCKQINESSSKYCNSCGMALDLKDFMQDQQILKEETDNRLKVFAEIMSNPEKKKQYEEFKKMFFNS